MSVICWFRKGLRLHDNPALTAAIDQGMELFPVFVLDPWFVANARVGPNRWRFLHESLTDLDNSLKAIGSRLFILKGKPEEALVKYYSKFDVKAITWEYDSEPYSKERDQRIEEISESKGVKVIIKHGHTLYEAERIFKANGNKVPLTYQAMQKSMSNLGAPPKPKPAPSQLPSHCEPKNKALMTSTKFNIPSLEDLNIDVSELLPPLYPGGESEALKRMKKCLSKKQWICNFEKPKTSPNSLEPSTTVLSPYLKFGCLSSRLFYYELAKVYEGNKHSQPPVSLHGQLLWREFFYAVGALSPNFDRMEGNPICKQIPWSNDQKLLEAWKHVRLQGRTGYPFIDALMTQLKREGWIHHLGRHAVACFLTRGDLWQSWEEGMKVFEEFLLDADWSLNAGNWMWLSASAFFHQYFRVYSPVAFGKSTDPDGDYIRKYIPALSKFPTKYIYEPWKAPLSDQKAAGCIIGQDYPRPIVDHDIARKKNLQKMSNAYKADKEKRGADDTSNKAKKKK
uniref:6-4 photolyase n=1 Tax=Eurydice pulchra TaxID=155694 RepID=T2C9E3_EURPU|nr:6-4 photolyase [Eurydice pulchra]